MTDFDILLHRVLLHPVEYRDRMLVDALRALDEDQLRAVLGRYMRLDDEAAGKAPKTCDIMRNVARRKDTLYVGCGGNGKVYQIDGTKWQLVPSLKNVFAVAANDRCVFAVTQRTVLRQCTHDTQEQPTVGMPRAP